MKTIISILAGAALLPAVVGCSQHEIPFYEGKDAIFFDQQYGVAHFDTIRQSHQLYSLVSFGTMAKRDSTVRIKVETTGYVRNYDRPFSVEVVDDSTNAIEGVEYELTEKNFAIRAGQNSCYVPITFHSTERMLETTVQVQLRLVPGEHFVLPFGEAGIGEMPKRYQGGDVFTEYSTNEDPSIHNIFANRKLKKPTGWNNLQYGHYYSNKKYALILQITEAELGWNVVDFEKDENNKMSLNRAPVIARHVAKYLIEQYNLGREYWVIDEDGSMMYVKGCPWAEGTDPAKMVD